KVACVVDVCRLTYPILVAPSTPNGTALPADDPVILPVELVDGTGATVVGATKIWMRSQVDSPFAIQSKSNLILPSPAGIVISLQKYTTDAEDVVYVAS